MGYVPLTFKLGDNIIWLAWLSWHGLAFKWLVLFFMESNIHVACESQLIVQKVPSYLLLFIFYRMTLILMLKLMRTGGCALNIQTLFFRNIDCI